MEFPKLEGVSIVREMLEAGDYTARYKGGEMAKAVIERKSVADLFHSFTHEYENEKEKIERAKQANLRYILAVEAPASEIRKGHRYWKDGEWHEVKKSGIAQIRQILTLLCRGDFAEVWWCRDRTDLAFLIQEYFLTHERTKGDRT